MKIFSLILSILIWLAVLFFCIWAFSVGGNLIPLAIILTIIDFGLIIPIVHDIKRIKNS